MQRDKAKELFKNLIVDFQERDLSYIFQRDLDVPLDAGQVISLIGVRRSGKTSCLYSLARDVRQSLGRDRAVYINFEDDRIFPASLEDLDGCIQGYYELFPANREQKVYFFFDEIQNVAYWEKFVRRVYDTENCQIVVSGSSSKLLGHEIATALRGRTLSYEIFPLSFTEFLRFRDIEPNLYSSKSLAYVKNAFEDYIRQGGFPELVNAQDWRVWKTLDEYLDLMMYKDIADRHGLSNTFLLKFLLKYCFSNVANLMSVNKLYNDLKSQGLKVSKNTIHEYLEHMQEAYAVFQVSKLSESYRERLRNPSKIYGIDIGFKRLVEYGPDTDTGRIFENIVFLELRRHTKDIYYYKGRQEVDFYCRLSDRPWLIQVSHDLREERTRARETKALTEAMHSTGVKNGLILTNDTQETLDLGDRAISILPLWKWLLDPMGVG